MTVLKQAEKLFHRITVRLTGHYCTNYWGCKLAPRDHDFETDAVRPLIPKGEQCPACKCREGEFWEL